MVFEGVRRWNRGRTACSVVVVVASLVTVMATLFVGGYAATGGGGGPSFGVVSVPVMVGARQLVRASPHDCRGFAIGFLFMLWRAMVKHQAGST